MSAYELPGVVGGLAGTVMFLLGSALASAAGVRIALALRSPGEGKGRIARGIAAAGGIVGIAGLLLFFGAQATRWARAFDLATPFVAIAAVVAGALVARRMARSPGAARPDEGSGRPAQREDRRSQ